MSNQVGSLKSSQTNYEVIEFYGDSVLNLITSLFLFEMF